MMIIMRRRSIFTLKAIILIFLDSSAVSFSQVPDDINVRLWRLFKEWGFAKYYHEHNFDVNWNDLLLKAIDSTFVST